MTETLYPYDVLSEYGIHPGSSDQDMADVGYLPRDVSEVWRAMRNPRFRMKADFFLYQVADGRRLREFQNYLAELESCPDKVEIQRRLQDDASLIPLLLNERAEARLLLEERQKADPANTRCAHHLALLSYADAQHYEEEGDEPRALEAWLLTIPNWIGVLSDNRYWESWRRQRQECYGNRAVDYVGSEITEAVRSELEQHLATLFFEYADRYARELKTSRAQTHQDLSIRFTIERQGAEALRAAGGVNLNNGQTLACGPMMLRRLDLCGPFTALVASLQSERDEFSAMGMVEYLMTDRMPRASIEVITRLRLYFSELAPAAALLSLNRPEQAIETMRALEQIPSDFSEKNPAYLMLNNGPEQWRKDAADLMIQAQLALSRRHITSTPPEFDAAAAIWREALREGRQAGAESMAAKAISDMAMARVQALRHDSSRNRMERLHEEVGVLKAAAAALRYSDGAVAESTRAVNTLLAERLARRGEEWSNSLPADYQAAVDDLRHAFDLEPERADIRNEYCTMLIYRAEEHAEEGEKPESKRLLGRAVRLAESGLRIHSDNEELKETLRSATDFLKQLEGRTDTVSTSASKSDDPFLLLQEAIHRANVSSEAVSSFADLMSRAEQDRLSGSYAAAVECLEQVLMLNSSHDMARRHLAHTYWEWASDLMDDGSFTEAEEIISVALRRTPGHSSLVKMRERIILRIAWCKQLEFDFAGALAELERALTPEGDRQRIFEARAQVYENWATYLLDEGVLDQAEKVITEGLDRHPDHPSLTKVQQRYLEAYILYNGVQSNE